MYFIHILLNFHFIRKLKCKQIQVNKMMSCNTSQVINAADEWHYRGLVCNKNSASPMSIYWSMRWYKQNIIWKFKKSVKLTFSGIWISIPRWDCNQPLNIYIFHSFQKLYHLIVAFDQKYLERPTAITWNFLHPFTIENTIPLSKMNTPSLLCATIFKIQMRCLAPG